jgi:periplasmic protein TonB
MFEQSMVESTGLLRTQNRWPAVVSFGMQAILVIAVISIPLVRPSVIALRAPRLAMLAPPVIPRRVPEPPPTVVHVTTSAASSMAAPVRAAATVAARIPVSGSTRAVDDGPVLLPFGSMVGPGGPISLSGGDTVGPVVRVAVAGSSGSKAVGPMRVSTGVSLGLLVHPIQPVYPPIARASRTEGVVIVQAIISKSGHIESAHAVSGPVMLQAAAVDAVRRAEYRPFLLNGQPTEVDTTISINFRMGG